MEPLAQVKELKMAYGVALTAREDAEKAIITLGARVSTLEEGVDRVEEALKAAKTEKSGLLLTQGEVRGRDVQGLRVKIRDLQDQFEDTKELLAATEKALKEAKESIVKLDAKVIGTRHEYLSAIILQEEGAIRDKVGDALDRTWVLCLDAGGYSTYEGFLRRIFPQPSLEEVQRMRAESKEI